MSEAVGNAGEVGRAHWQALELAAIFALLLTMPLSAAVLTGQPLSASILPIYAAPAVYLSDVALLLWLLAAVKMRRSLRPAINIGAPLLGLALAGLALAPWAAQAGFSLYIALRWVAGWLVFRLFSGARLASKHLVVVFVAGLLLQSLLGIGQVLMRGPLGVPGELAVPADLWGAAVVETGGPPFLRAYGLTFHPNVLGGFLVVGLLVGLPLTRGRWARVAWWLMGLGLILSLSRSAGLAAICLVPLAAWWIRRHRPELFSAVRTTMVGLALLVLAAVAALGRPIATRLQPAMWESERTSIVTRIRLAQAAVVAIRSAPLTGIGPGHFPLWIAEHQPEELPQSVHNIPMLMAAELGLSGGLLGLALILAPVILLVTRWHALSLWALLFGLGAVGVCWIGLFDSYPWSLNSGRELLAFTLGMSMKEVGAEIAS
jgi:hypothetical protein